MVEVHADDTDIAVMLVHHWKEELHDILFCAKQSKKSWSIKGSSMAMPTNVKDVLTFIHAFSGCDTTSALFGIGKATIFKKFKGRYIFSTLFKTDIQAVQVSSMMPKN